MSAAPPHQSLGGSSHVSVQAASNGKPSLSAIKEGRRLSQDTINDTSSIATFDLYGEPSAHDEVVEAINIYDYADSLQASTSTSAAASAADTSSLVSRLKNQASLNGSITSSQNAEHLPEQTEDRLEDLKEEPSRPGSSWSDLKSRPPSSSGRTYQDPNGVLKLMRQTKGLMHGKFSFRLSPHDRWLTAYGYIAPHVGSLLYNTPTKSAYDALLPDLRACHVTSVTDNRSQETFICLRVRKTAKEVHIKPQDQAYLVAWLAAFLCWREMPHREQAVPSQKRQPRPLPQSDSAEATVAASNWRETQTLRSGEAVLLEPRHTSTAQSVNLSSDDVLEHCPTTPRDVKRIRVSCLLRGSGQLLLYLGSGGNVLVDLQVRHLTRSGVQRADYSLFNSDRVLALRPRCGRSETSGRLSPIFLAFNEREEMETWFVLLQTIAQPDLYGPRELSISDEYSLPVDNPQAEDNFRSMLRIKHSLTCRINRVTIPSPNKRSSKPDQMQPTKPPLYYAEMLLDDEVYARTSEKTMGRDTLLFHDVRALYDVPSYITSLGVRVRKHEPKPPPPDNVTRVSWTSALEDIPHVEDVVCGETALPFTSLDGMAEDFLLALYNDDGDPMGEVAFKIEHQREVILTEREYDKVIELLERLAVPLTMAFSENIKAGELALLAERLLNIFLVCGNVQEWLLGLAEREIGASNTPPRSEISSPDSQSLASEDAMQANRSSPPTGTALLFRGNTLFTKALDIYMKRVGQAYLVETLGKKMKEIAIYEPDCEVDPARLAPDADLEKNWRRLMDATKDVWQLIYKSAEQCPMELRFIFRRIRKCAAATFGKVVPTAKYTSVSGFLFLRFFCPAVLNPHLFSLIEDDTTITAPRAARAFMLIAKSLQGLANLTSFGNKEPWMTRMNHFCTTHAASFRTFIDTICAVPDDWIPPNGLETHLIAHSSTRNQYMRLSPSAREGIPSLPHLIDRPRDVAALLRQWSAVMPEDATNRLSTVSIASVSSQSSIGSDIPSFAAAHLAVRRKTLKYLSQVERGSEMQDEDRYGIPCWVYEKWTSMAQRMEVRPEEFWVHAESAESLYAGYTSGMGAGTGKGDANSSSGGKRGTGLFKKVRSEKDNRDKERGREDPYRRGPPTTATGGGREDPYRKTASGTSLAPSGAPSGASTHRSVRSSESGGKKSKRPKSPPRNAQDNAMRKLGWM